jgi:hypothetical protein
MVRKPLFFILVLSLFAAIIQVAYSDEEPDKKYSLSQNEGQMGLKVDRGTEANGLVLNK